MMVQMRTTQQRIAWISFISCGVLIVVFFGLLSSERSDSLKAVATAAVTSSSPPTATASQATSVSKDKSAAAPSQPSEMAQMPAPETGKKIFELPDGRYLEIIESLKVAAEKGDANASYAIARMLVDCKEVFENNDSRLLERNKPADQNLTAEKKPFLKVQKLVSLKTMRDVWRNAMAFRKRHSHNLHIGCNVPQMPGLLRQELTTGFTHLRA